MRKIFLSSLAVNFLVMVLHFSTGILSARYLGPEGRGELAVVMRWSGLMGLLLTFGLPGAVTFLGKQMPKLQSEYVGAYLAIGSGIGLIGMGGGVLILPLLLSNQSSEVVSLACVSLLGLPTMLLSDGLIGTLSTLDKFRKVILLRFFFPFGALLIILFLVYFHQYTVSASVYGSLIWSILFFGLTAAFAFTACRPSMTGLWRRSRELARKGRQIYLPSLVTLFGDNLDMIVISLFLSPLVLGYYTVASSVGSILPSVMNGALSVFLLPKLMELSGPHKRRTVEKIHGTMIYGSLGLTLISGVCLPIILPLLYGQQFAGAVIMGEVLLMLTPFRIASNVLANFISSEDKFKYVTEAEIVCLVTGAATTLGLLSVGEGVGAAVGVAVGTMARWMFLMYRAVTLGVNIRGMVRFEMAYILSAMRSMTVKKQAEPVRMRQSG